jgi:hypothetical protein
MTAAVALMMLRNMLMDGREERHDAENGSEDRASFLLFA